MDILVNDLSVHQQFHDSASFHEALSRLMVMRSTARRHGRELYCNRGFPNAHPISRVPMKKAIAMLPIDRRRAVFGWLSRRGGPFWDDVREHGAADYFECNGDIVTDTAVGEAASRLLNSADCGLVSLSPSRWEFSPVEVIWRRQAENLDDASAMLKNWWDDETLNRDLKDTAQPINSWHELRDVSAIRFDNLIFREDCFSHLDGTPFARASSDRFMNLLEILDRLAGEYDENGRRTPEGYNIYQKHFTGERASFSDSSDSEKNDFRRKLTFTNPSNPDNPLLCSWHGKVSHLTLRLHFSWPIVASRPVYIMYAGPKITKR